MKASDLGNLKTVQHPNPMITRSPSASRKQHPTVIAEAKLAEHFHAPFLNATMLFSSIWVSPTSVRSVNSTEAMASGTTSSKKGEWA